MIAFLKGILSEKTADGVVLDVNGVGYNVTVPKKSLDRLPGAGSEVKLYTHLSVREDAMKLFGFCSRDELSYFRTLLSVNKVGPKMAVDILGFMDADELRLAILSSDSKTLSKCPGVGSKTAQRIILDLKDSVDIGEALTASLGGIATEGATSSGPNVSEAIEALVALGFSQTECAKAVGRIEDAAMMSSEEIIKAALKFM